MLPRRKFTSSFKAAWPYSLPEQPIPILVSGFGPKAIKLAAGVGDGFVSTKPDAEHISLYRDRGGRGPTVGACKLCWAKDQEQAVETVHRLWPNEALSGELSQELPMPRHFEEAVSVVTKEMVASSVPCGPDPEVHLATLRKYFEAGFDELYMNQIGDDMLGFLEFFNRELRPELT